MSAMRGGAGSWWCGIEDDANYGERDGSGGRQWYCKRCGAVVDREMCGVHTRWHQELAQQLSF